ncbi:MAG: citrate (Si)-synthase [Bacteroidetes bacterium MED-G17]|nr:MAG: citrate (Si)-synthase [Bacteroidetes bacterium TMED39]PDH53034.1 MAG: citrate (Si)-synthase [Bacteroidetes bacterium MED-G17]CAI8320372.1 MAG: Citrate synthase 1 [Bacteroidetes bacterium MED-G17]|tara:strand:- start:7182 stop:8486 length:1305 start_codon:yes stop_codon:yes gene_type:complete
MSDAQIKNNNATLNIEGKKIDLPYIKGTEGEIGLDVSKLRGQSGVITLDVGFKNTGSTTSAITFLDGEQGILRHRGYAIEDLTEKCSFLEVAYLLIYGELPSKETFEKFDTQIRNHTLVHEDIQKIFNAYPTGSHPMGQITTLVSSLSSFYPQSLNPNRSEDEINLTIIRLLAKMITLASMIYKKSIGHPIIYPDNNLDYVSNFLNMTFKKVSEPYQMDPIVVDTLNKLLILHADHEQNCSTSTVRMVGSSQANLYASISAGVVALWGPLHGGANQKVIEMLEAIKDDGGNVHKYINKAKDKNDPFRLMGFGHRVYKNYDPRAKIIKKNCDQILENLGINDPVLDIAKNLEETALNDQYFIDRKLFPNIDFYSGIIYRAIGFPLDMFTVLFALGRLPGWIAQWKEMQSQNQPISRPRQIYTGEKARDFVDISAR